jgi:hypothetical protein
MAFQLPLSKRFQRQWTVKIRDRERVEPPHVTVLRRTQAWRLDLRTGDFLDREPDPDEVPEALLAAIRRQWALLCERWDEMYPENPVASEENDDE